MIEGQKGNQVTGAAVASVRDATMMVVKLGQRTRLHPGCQVAGGVHPNRRGRARRAGADPELTARELKIISRAVFENGQTMTRDPRHHK
jgi:hypothetical protein